MSDYTDSLPIEESDEFGTHLCNLLDHATDRHSAAQTHNKSFASTGYWHDEEIYWQGRKDSIRSVLAAYLNEPSIIDIINSTVYAHVHNHEV